MSDIDYLVIGHVSCDLVPNGTQLGGSVVFSSRTAHVLGCRTAVLTSASTDLDLSDEMVGIELTVVESQETTSFKNEYTPLGRQQTLYGRANPLTIDDIPPHWRRSPIVHLAPIANELPPDMINAFSNSLVGLTPQGWLRRWDEDGRVYASEWPEAEKVLPLAGAVILSEEDIPDRKMFDQFKRWTSLLVLTQAADGCTVFFRDEARHIPAPHVSEVEPTGAGDVFTAAFLIRMRQTAGNPWEAARFANELASRSVTQGNFEAKIAHIKKYFVTS